MLQTTEPIIYTKSQTKDAREREEGGQNFNMNKYYQLFPCIYVIMVSLLWINNGEDIFPKACNDCFTQVWKWVDANNEIFSLTTSVTRIIIINIFELNGLHQKCWRMHRLWTSRESSSWSTKLPAGQLCDLGRGTSHLFSFPISFASLSTRLTVHNRVTPVWPLVVTKEQTSFLSSTPCFHFYLCFHV